MIRSILSSRWMLLGIALAGSPAAYAHGPDGHHPPDRPYVPSTVIPETLPQVVVALRSAHASAQAALTAGKLTDAAPNAQAIIDLALAVPTKIAGLTAEQQAVATTRSQSLRLQAETARIKAWTADPTALRVALDAAATDIAALEALGK